jgi:hypothetical protein
MDLDSAIHVSKTCSVKEKNAGNAAWGDPTGTNGTGHILCSGKVKPDPRNSQISWCSCKWTGMSCHVTGFSKQVCMDCFSCPYLPGTIDGGFLFPCMQTVPLGCDMDLLVMTHGGVFPLLQRIDLIVGVCKRACQPGWEVCVQTVHPLGMKSFVNHPLIWPCSLWRWDTLGSSCFRFFFIIALLGI